MKKFLVFLFIPIIIFGQDVTFEKKHLGILYVGSIDQTSNKLNINHNVNVMAAFEASYHISDIQSLVYRVRISNPNDYYGAFWHQYQWDSIVTIKTGVFSRPISFVRPHPCSNDAQFEPSSQAAVPGSDPGINLHYGQKFGISVGYFYNTNVKANELNFSLGHKSRSEEYLFTGYWNKENRGLALYANNNLLKSMFYIETDSIMSFLFVGKNKVIEPYFDWVINHKNKKTLKMEIGITKELSAQFNLQTLVGYGYNVVQKIHKIYFWVYFK